MWACGPERPGADPMTSTSAGAGRDGQLLRGESVLIRYLNFVKLPHTLFALPFALLGVLAASWTFPET